jgi:uncharacterized protein YegJ (DUF2314 family)
MDKRITLLDGVQRNAEFPATFHIPSDADKAAVQPGDFVKVGFVLGAGTDREASERMWVEVTGLFDHGDTSGFIGNLNNDPVFIPIEDGDQVEFEARHMLAIMKADTPKGGSVGTREVHKGCNG